MGTHDGAIDKMKVPVHPAGLVRLLLHGGQNPVPDAGGPPAIEATGDRLIVAIPLGQILPRRAGAQEPLDAIDDRTMVVIGPPCPRFLGRQQGRQARPLLVS